MSAIADTCALCPRLCRHVCPVAVGTGLESATPTAILTEVMISNRSKGELQLAAQAVDLCTRCGHCEDFCGVDQPVVALLDDARTRLQDSPPAWTPPRVQGYAPTVAIICGAVDWSEALSEHTGQEFAILKTHDHLGEAHRIRTDTRDEVIALLARTLQGRTAISSCATCTEALAAADITVEPIEAVSQQMPRLPTWRTCHCAPGPSVDTIVRCCGARAPLTLQQPELARAMSAEILRRLDGQAIYVPNTRCAEHLQDAGVQAVGPADSIPNMED